MSTRRRRSEAAEPAEENGRRAEGAVEEAARPRSEAPVAPRTRDLLGRHRLSAAIGLLEQEIESLQKEVAEVETMKPSSAACREVVLSMEGIPDALLPVTRGPQNAAWDRWFQRIRSSRAPKWWAQKERQL